MGPVRHQSKANQIHLVQSGVAIVCVPFVQYTEYSTPDERLLINILRFWFIYVKHI